MNGGSADPEPSDLAHPPELLDERATIERELTQADADYAAGNTVSGEDLRKRFGLTEATPAPHRKFGQLPDLVIPDNFGAPLPDFEDATPEGPLDA
ncbi:hypothetical protein [Mycolicibacterium sarraceniae]|uniref:Uncharacterized protein n=1 Tax=Mycolicibacterium sarraceniae TaxID=1534348 RepID=A0A7I7SWD6_9MYCO|nr:hypothetical protein [Mycolicibacterium sarraceniae]BBY60960.1 hypothetical protein MSAR_40960 [Mycolicibacterium sarraceniae]